MFFNSWQLWEKMTFILALAIFGVFGIGFVKLIWTNRLMRRQEIVDEEKRAKIQELRNSGQIVESRKSHDIPFGVRAIQNGIQVDGIWISQSTTPVISELDHFASNSSQKLATEQPNQIAQVPEDIAAQGIRPGSRHGSIRPSSVQGNPPPRNTELDNLYGPNINIQEIIAPRRPGSAGSLTSYKPKRSSHLRFGSPGEHEDKTLGQQEGPSPTKKKIHSHKPRGARQVLNGGDSSSVADNERSSGTSSDSDATLSSTAKLQARISCFTEPPPEVEREFSSLNISTVPSGRAVRSSFQLHSSKAEYFSIPAGSPSGELSDPFLTPLSSPLDSPRVYKPPRSPIRPDSSWLDNSINKAQSGACSPSPFVPGELHVNKTVRKVNSGFEVLPAGTFGVATEFKGQRVDSDQDDQRKQSKLQKKPRNSMTGHRESNAIEQP